jgi:hypothetical protein
MLSFFVMAAPLPQTRTILTWKMAAARQNRHLEQIPIPCGARATIVAAETSWTAILPTPLIFLECWLLSCQNMLRHNAMRRFASMTGWEEERDF